MSSQNEFPGPGAGRPARIPSQDQLRQPAWPSAAAPTATPPQPSQYPPNWQQQPAPAYSVPRPSPYGQWNGQQAPQHAPAPAPHYPPMTAAPIGYTPPSAPVDPYAPQFEPYAAPQRHAPNFAQPGPAPSFGHPHPQPQPLQALPPQQLQTSQPPQWPHRAPAPRGFDAGGVAQPRQPMPTAPQPMQNAPAFSEPRYEGPDLGHPDWGPEPSLGIAHDPYQQAQGEGEFGFAHAEGGELEQAFADEDGEYEIEDSPRGRRPMMIAAALVGAILVGGGMAYSYKKIALASSGSDRDPPIIKSEAFASKTKPADAGGKQFPYADSKIMSRLGDGTSPAPAADSSSATAAASDTSSGPSSSVDENGTRKVSTLVVGRDGTIQAPASAPVVQPATVSQAATAPPMTEISVPGTQIVDVFGAARAQNAANSAPPASRSPERLASADAGDTLASPKKKTPAVAKINSASSAKAAPTTTGSVDNDADAPVAPAAAKKKLKKVAHADTTATDAASDAAAAAPVTSPSGGSGFVAVLASVPKSSSSRMDALKRFADMQQKYATALAGKTPDVADAHLGSKGEYHRLIVGPPGSREQASAVCTQLKADGYTGCWVTAY